MRTILALLLLSTASRADDLAQKLAAVMDGQDYKSARWAVLVADMKTGTPVFARNADSLATPASVTKLFSCAAALVLLGPDSTVETPVYRRGDVDAKGTLKGDLILAAKGDLTLGGRTLPDGTVAFQNNDHTYANGGSSPAELTPTDPLAGLNSLAAQVAKAGIKRVTGEILIDDRLFDPSFGSGSGPGTVTPILVNDNVVDVVLTPGAKPGEKVGVKLVPETRYVSADVEVVTGPVKSKEELTLRAAGPNRFSVRGSLPAGGKTALRIYAVGDPAGFTRGLFVEALLRHGVRVDAAVAAAGVGFLPSEADYRTLPKVAAFTSPPFKESVKVTLKVSHNLYASTLPSLLAARKGLRSTADGLQEQRKILGELGVDTSAISFAGGAGGANADCVTPAATVKLIRAMRQRPEWDAYKAGLPVLGVDGTLTAVVPADSPAKGKVFAKTGTLSWDDLLNGRQLLRSKALAGTTTTAGGTELAFAIFVNDVPLPPGVPTSREGKVLGKMAELIYRHGP